MPQWLRLLCQIAVLMTIRRRHDKMRLCRPLLGLMRAAFGVLQQMGNKGAFITFKGDDLTPQFTQYSAVSHPSVRPMQYAGGNLS